jgi:hypothetical protein
MNIERLTLARAATSAAALRLAAKSPGTLPGNGDLGHLEGDVAAVADDLAADLDQLLLQAGQRPGLDRFGRRQRAQEIAEIVDVVRLGP